MIAGRTGGTCAFRAGVFKPVATACAIAIGLLVLLEGAARVTEIWIPPLEMDYGLGFEPGSRLFIPSPEDPSVMITHPAKALLTEGRYQEGMALVRQILRSVPRHAPKSPRAQPPCRDLR